MLIVHNFPLRAISKVIGAARAQAALLLIVSIPRHSAWGLIQEETKQCAT